MAKKPTKQTQKDEFGLTRLERAFADNFILTGNKKGSAIKAGVKAANAGVYATRMLKNVTLQQYLAPRMQKVSQQLTENFELNVERVLRELAAIALFDPGKLYDENGDLLPVNKMDEMTRRAIAGVDVKELCDKDGALVGYVKKVKPVSKIAALELAGRNLAMWGEKDSGALSILNINIITNQNQLDNPPQKVIEHDSKPIF